MNIADFLIVLVSFFILLPGMQAQENPNYSLTDDSRLWIEGDATLHGWDAEATEFEVDFSFPDAWFDTMDNWSGKDVETLKVRVPVSALDGGRSRMNRDLREAMKAESYPMILFHWETIEVKAAQENKAELNVTGKLEAAGVERDIEFSADASLIAGESFKISGKAPLKMTDFGIDPPRALLGTLRTDDDIEILFEMVFEKEIESD